MLVDHPRSCLGAYDRSTSSTDETNLDVHGLQRDEIGGYKKSGRSSGSNRNFLLAGPGVLQMTILPIGPIFSLVGLSNISLGWPS